MIPHQISDNLNHIKSQLISTTSNAQISVNYQRIQIKFWILHRMTNPNKVYDTTPNLNHSKSQIISTTSNAQILVNSQPIFLKLQILHPIFLKLQILHLKTYHTKSQLNPQLQSPNLNKLQMLLSLPILNRCGSNFGFYIS